jgi:hypothetical protein
MPSLGKHEKARDEQYLKGRPTNSRARHSLKPHIETQLQIGIAIGCHWLCQETTAIGKDKEVF